MINSRLLKTVPSSRKFIFLTVLLKTLSLFANVFLIFSAARLIASRGENPLAPSLCIAASALASALCAYLSSVSSFRSSAQVKKTLRTLLYEKLLRLGAKYQEKAETAKIVQLAAEGIEQLEVYFGSYAPQFFYSIIAALSTFAVLSFLNLKMALILLLCVPLIPLSIVAIQKIAKRILSKYWGQYASLADNFLENLQGLTTLKIYGADGFKQKKMDEEAEHFRRVTMKVLSMQLNSIIVMDVVAYSGAGLGIAAALSSVYSGALSVEHAIVCILLSADFFIPLRRLGSFFHTAMNGTTASRKLFELLDSAERENGKLKVGRPADSRIPIFETENLGCSFGERNVLHGCSISIEEGSFVSFVGKSGSGKSTLAKILCGLNDYSGSARIFGTEIGEIDRNSLNKFIAYISHRDWIFSGTVRDTLLEGKPDATETEMLRALDSVRLSDFLKENGGLDFRILENASNLSGGQKQRLSIARAILHDPEVFVFDEATSNVDVESESAILEFLRSLKGKKTVLMISHRIETPLPKDCVHGGTQKPSEFSQKTRHFANRQEVDESKCCHRIESAAGADKIYNFEEGEVSPTATMASPFPPTPSAGDTPATPPSAKGDFL